MAEEKTAKTEKTGRRPDFNINLCIPEMEKNEAGDYVQKKDENGNNVEHLVNMGSLWKNTSKDGKTYFTGNLGRYGSRIKCFEVPPATRGDQKKGE